MATHLTAHHHHHRPSFSPSLREEESRHDSPSLEERRQAVLQKVLKMKRRESSSRDGSSSGGSAGSSVERAVSSGEDELAGKGTAHFLNMPQGASLVKRSVVAKCAASYSQRPQSAATTTPLIPRKTMEMRTAPSPEKRLAVVLAPSPVKKEDYLEVADEESEEPSSKRRVISHSTPVQDAFPSLPTTAEGGEARNTEASPKMNRRGRPKGWKPGMAYTDLRPRSQRTAPKPSTSASSTTGQKRRGRPPRPASPPPREIYLQENAEFFMFICEWRGCRAELHNLETLRRHIAVVHGRQDGCGWGCCRFSVPREDRERGWLRSHVENEHLVPLAWHVGDGPRHRGDGVGGPVPTAPEGGFVVPRWLKDGQGNQVTEGIWTQEMEDKATWRERRRKLRELLIRRDENLPSEEEDGVGETEGSRDRA